MQMRGRKPVSKRITLIAFVALSAAIGASCGAVVGPDAASTSAALFDQVWSDVDLHYSFFQLKQVNWDSIRTVFRPRALATTTDVALSATIGGMLGTLQDDHVTFRGSRVWASSRAGIIDPTDIVPFVATTMTFEPDGLSYGFVDSAVGYIAIGSFDGLGWLPQVDSALTAMAAVKSIIIDVRNNQGGFLSNALDAAGRFADQTTTVAYVRYRDGPGHGDFTSSIAQQVSPSGTTHFGGRVYLLTGRNTISAAELFVLSMRALGHTTVVGDTTAGETGSPFARELQNGWSYQFPESIEYMLDGRTFEDIGLAPDVTVLNSSRRLTDSQLAQAIALAHHGS
jgi:C-terminal processing protease CtpA/Prc